MPAGSCRAARHDGHGGSVPGLCRAKDCPLAWSGMDWFVSVKTFRMPEDPDELVDAIAVAVRAGDDRRIGLLLDRFKEVAGLSHLIRLRDRLCGVSVLRG